MVGPQPNAFAAVRKIACDNRGNDNEFINFSLKF